jgi:hypothetical protein
VTYIGMSQSHVPLDSSSALTESAQVLSQIFGRGVRAPALANILHINSLHTAFKRRAAMSQDLCLCGRQNVLVGNGFKLGESDRRGSHAVEERETRSSRDEISMG